MPNRILIKTAHSKDFEHYHSLILSPGACIASRFQLANARWLANKPSPKQEGLRRQRARCNRRALAHPLVIYFESMPRSRVPVLLQIHERRLEAGTNRPSLQICTSSLIFLWTIPARNAASHYGRPLYSPHATRCDLAVHKFYCAACGRVKTKILLRTQALLSPELTDPTVSALDSEEAHTLAVSR
jgi:hypothetical protein